MNNCRDGNASSNGFESGYPDFSPGSASDKVESKGFISLGLGFPICKVRARDKIISTVSSKLQNKEF